MREVEPAAVRLGRPCDSCPGLHQNPETPTRRSSPHHPQPAGLHQAPHVRLGPEKVGGVGIDVESLQGGRKGGVRRVGLPRHDGQARPPAPPAVPRCATPQRPFCPVRTRGGAAQEGAPPPPVVLGRELRGGRQGLDGQVRSGRAGRASWAGRPRPALWPSPGAQPGAWPWGPALTPITPAGPPRRSRAAPALTPTLALQTCALPGSRSGRR